MATSECTMRRTAAITLILILFALATRIIAQTTGTATISVQPDELS